MSIMAGIFGAGLQGGAEQGIKEMEFQQNTDLVNARDARLNEWREKHDVNMLDRQSKIEDKRTERAEMQEDKRTTRAEAAQIAAEERQRRDLDSRETRQAGRDKSLIDREDVRQTGAEARADREAERKREHDEALARRSQITENTKLMTKLLETSGPKDPEYLRLQQENKLLANPPKVGGGLPPKPGGSAPTRDDTASIYTNEFNKLSDQVDALRAKPEAKEELARAERDLAGVKAEMTRQKIAFPERKKPGSSAAASPKSAMQTANPYMDESNYTIDDLNRLAMQRPNDPMVQEALRARGRLSPVNNPESQPIMQGAGIL